jgi:hypothetical protein
MNLRFFLGFWDISNFTKQCCQSYTQPPAILEDKLVASLSSFLPPICLV